MMTISLLDLPQARVGCEGDTCSMCDVPLEPGAPIGLLDGLPICSCTCLLDALGVDYNLPARKKFDDGGGSELRRRASALRNQADDLECEAADLREEAQDLEERADRMDRAKAARKTPVLAATNA